jgi:hypothetical protein
LAPVSGRTDAIDKRRVGVRSLKDFRKGTYENTGEHLIIAGVCIFSAGCSALTLFETLFETQIFF